MSFNPVPVYDRATSWEAPVLRVHDDPPLEVMAIDNLPSLLPLESSEDFAAQLLPHLASLKLWTNLCASSHALQGWGGNVSLIASGKYWSET